MPYVDLSPITNVAPSSTGSDYTALDTIGTPGIANFNAPPPIFTLNSPGTWNTQVVAYQVPVDRQFLVSVKDMQKRMGEKASLYTSTQRYGYDLEEMKKYHQKVDPISFFDGHKAAAGKYIKTVTNFDERFVMVTHNAKATKGNIDYLAKNLQTILPMSFKVYFKIRKRWVLMSGVTNISNLKRVLVARKRGTLHIKITW